ncbi:hypothetical protein C8F04DRAFT_1264631 [Mycena alexandri]|uniref:Uncharacterized protein n=1 Tax=Mycena alexandri TaxID=1745969 RepID=A0AAD6SNP5_9AGAR|nr:hypothetical protein C8F04DRAFT_1264631 [Mycena alexandri]
MPVVLSRQSSLTADHSFSKRRLPPGRFCGEREKFLMRQLSKFYQAVDYGTVHNYWPRLFREYWKQFPWRLPFDRDPHCGMIIDTEPLSPQDLDAHTVVQLQTQAKLRAWFQKKHLMRARLGA